MSLTIICAWCNPYTGGEGVSHGICETCLAVELAKLKKPNMNRDPQPDNRDPAPVHGDPEKALTVCEAKNRRLNVCHKCDRTFSTMDRRARFCPTCELNFRSQ